MKFKMVVATCMIISMILLYSGSGISQEVTGMGGNDDVNNQAK